MTRIYSVESGNRDGTNDCLTRQTDVVTPSYFPTPSSLPVPEGSRVVVFPTGLGMAVPPLTRRFGGSSERTSVPMGSVQSAGSGTGDQCSILETSRPGKEGKKRSRVTRTVSPDHLTLGTHVLTHCHIPVIPSDKGFLYLSFPDRSHLLVKHIPFFRLHNRSIERSL